MNALRRGRGIMSTQPEAYVWSSVSKVIDFLCHISSVRFGLCSRFRLVRTSPTTPNMSMRAVVVDGSNKASASSLSIGEAALPKINDDNQVLVAVHAFGLNRMDIMQRKGMYPLPPGVTPILGVEFSGVVQDAGKKAAESWKKGDEVYADVPMLLQTSQANDVGTGLDWRTE